ncbi:uncharacterized protein TRIADDRAFT_60790 [Trichoplax adhaerens]|uniref:Uncharacterized protein n=1 Tax=Trichoplax adhaerens TaxID=10228 RepID=B3S8Y7_TRIAD|nr:hypothetical protein TRIADDRAFT_60790 [Trichoplax adhaerens]EDV20852.1 hypothetical protein TRIADDRAFT_60790 [Trichoplax adhaerens]|eukprot:XP_002116793.1 hypothetical protein TRIADDRAFT_60790 [Trichoplax adhaerens]
MVNGSQFSYVYAHEMLSLLNSLLGQAYVETMGGRIEQRRLAMQAFVDSVRCAIEARSYTLAMSAIRHYWNTCLPLVKPPLERKLLIEPLTFLLESISDLYRIHNKSKADEVKSKLTFDQGDPKLKQSLQDSNQTAEEYIDDLTIRAAMYGVLFLGYADKDQYKEGLQAMDKAISHMPRTHHRLLIFKHRVIFKAKLGKNVLPDIAKFRDENERVVAEMWRYVAECSDDRLEQLSSYQNSIEVLKNSESQWQKFDYLLEFGCWLHRHLFPLQDAIDQLNQITASKTLHELALIQERQAEAKKAKDKNANKDSTKELQVLKLPKRKSNTIHPSAALPTTIDAWSTYELPDDFRNAIKNDTTGCGFNKISINKPMLTFQIMKDFLELCQQSGYHQLCPPLVSMMTLLAQDVIEHKTLISYSRLLSIQLYQDLNLVSGVKHHEQIAGDVVIDESEQAKSREEIHEWQEIQNRVELEGEKIAAKKKATVRFEDDYDDKPETTIKSVKNSIDIRNFEFNSTVAIKSLKIVIGNVSLRHLWTDTAELLIKQGRYQSARQYLTEAQFSAEVFDDKELMTRIYYNLAVILYREANIPHALAKLIDAQKNAVDKGMWLKTILCLVDVLLQDSYRKSQAKTVLLHSIGCLVELAEERKNEVNYITYVKALLTARLAALEMEESKEMENYSQLHATLITALEHYNTSIEDLKNEGFKREASKVLIEQGKLKNLLANVASTTDDQHQYLLEALQSYEEAVQLSNDVYVDSTTLKPVLKPREANLPVQRESIQARLAFANHVIVIMITADAEDQQKRKLDARKDSVQRVFDEYVRPTPIPNSIDTIWKTAINTFTGKALTHLSIAHHLAGSSIKLKAEVLYAAGKSLRLKAFQANPSEVLPWNDLLLTNNQKNLLNNEVPDQKNDKDLYELSDGSISDQDEARDDKSELELEFGNRKYRAIRYLFNYGLSQNYLAQANDCVSQCVHLCLSHRHHDILSLAALEMVECCGRYDPLTTAQYLALHQSCAASQFLYETLMGAQRDPTASRQAALLQQRRHIKIASCDINEAISTTLQSNLDLLEVTSEAWKFISISPNHLDLMKDLPAGISCIILQHSPDKSVLYGAMLEKSKTATIKATKLSSQNLPINASVARADVSPIQLDNLLEKFDQYKKDLSAALVRWNRLEHIQQQQEKLISSFDGESDIKEAKEQQKFTAEEESLQANFNDLITDLDEYLSPILDKFDFIGRPGTGRTGTSNMSGPPGSSHTTGDFLVILADKELLRLPLEATSFFRSASVSSISRDFSLQILRHRLIDDEGREKREKRKPKVSDQIKPTTTSKRSDKKGKQQNLTERAPPANGLNINSSYVRFEDVVDTKNFGSDMGEFSPSQVMTSILKSRPAVTNRWYGLMGNDHAPSLGEWQRILLQSSAFIYYAYERCLADFSPKYLAPLNLPDCRLVVILDQAHSYQSFHNQAKIDAQKSVEELQLEEPLETAALFTLSGVGSVVINQWGTKLQQNKERIRQFIGDPVKEQKLLEQDLASSHKGSLDIAAAVEARRREEEENTNSVQLSYDWYNTVIYGLPNLIIN